MNDATSPAFPVAAATSLGGAERRALLDVAEEAIRRALATGERWAPDLTRLHADLGRLAATFVTLERRGALLGCIGTLEPQRPLAHDVAHHALAAAFADPRLPPVTRVEFVEMSIKVSVLSRPEPLPAASYSEVAAQVRVGVDGLLLAAPGFRSTLLPSVWSKVADAGEFLSVLWRKGGLRPGAWPAGTLVHRYTTEEFGSPGPRPAVT